MPKIYGHRKCKSLVAVAREDHTHNDFNYSTEEVKTDGVWIDGKPIYRKVLTGSITTVKKDTTIGTIGPIESVIRAYGFFDCGSGNLMPLNHYYNENWYAIGYVWKSGTSGVLLCNCSAKATVCVVVEYTKPTE